HVSSRTLRHDATSAGSPPSAFDRLRSRGVCAPRQIAGCDERRAFVGSACIQGVSAFARALWRERENLRQYGQANRIWRGEIYSRAVRVGSMSRFLMKSPSRRAFVFAAVPALVAVAL